MTPGRNEDNSLWNFDFTGFFKAAEIANFNKEEREAYEESLKYYRDIKNVVDTSKEEGKEEKALEIAANLKQLGLPTEDIIKATGLDKEIIEGIETKNE